MKNVKENKSTESTSTNGQSGPQPKEGVALDTLKKWAAADLQAAIAFLNIIAVNPELFDKVVTYIHEFNSGIEANKLKTDD